MSNETRKDDLIKIFSGMADDILTIVEPMIDNLVFIESQLDELRDKPFIRYHPTDPSIQKATVSGRMYKDLLAQEKDIVRILCSQLNKNGDTTEESPLRTYLKGMKQ